MFESLKGRVIVVLGGAGLLGREIVAGIANHGGLVVLVDKSRRLALAAAEDMTGPDSLPIIAEHVDIMSESSLNNLMRRLKRRYGKIDGVVNATYPKNSTYGKKFEDVTYQDFCENLCLHLGSSFLISKCFSIYFKKQGFGTIVNIASIYGVIAPKFEIYNGTEMTMPVEYAAIKSSIIHLTKYIAKYMKGSNVRINAVSPGGIFAGQPIEFVKNYNSCCLGKGMLSKSDVVGAILYLLSDISSGVNGQNLVIDDGFSI
ncbi:oxidoreductase [Polynucleobacter sp. JS-JIR-5-A7]|uniref:oxidoreductase n=1 Tax=Polynucleobacter sp. JS-JIR-5-A7 TaxID=1758395 RepID=UPI001BFCDDA4|nr:oxidoreductase [Polynucleobacter sp. JS-JIR-5-A7]QWE06942.1 SDR family oxidoreductase [Polynucleobacter sp. JS-JIR-5-A7]